MRAWQLSTIEKLCDKNCKYYVDLVEELTEARLVLVCRRAPEANMRAALREYVRASLREDPRCRRCDIRGGEGLAFD
jgi:hypothetical protein